MAPGTIKKMKSRRSESFGIRTRKGCSKPAVELRLSGNKEKIWRVMDDLESAKRFVKLVCLYTDREKAFPPDHPDLPHLEAFRKNEFEAFIWEEFQGHDATELLQDSEEGIDHGKRVEPMMPTYAPESSCVHFEVEPNSQNAVLLQSEVFAFGVGGDSRAGVISPEDSRPPFAPTQAGDVQACEDRLWYVISTADSRRKPCRSGLFQLTPWPLRPEQIYAQLQHERIQVAQERLQVEHRWRQVEHGRQQLAYERLQFADVRCAVLRQRGAREGVAPKRLKEEPGRKPRTDEECNSLKLHNWCTEMKILDLEEIVRKFMGFAPTLENAELDASLAPIPFEGDPSHTPGSIASPGCDDLLALPDIPEYVEDMLELFLRSSPQA